MTDDIDTDVQFERFVAAEFGAIVALALALLRDPDGALDVAQETMARAYERRHDVLALERPGGWARRVALNLVTDAQRRRTRRRRLHARLRALPSPVEEAASVRWDHEFWTLVAALPTRQRDVVVLHYVDDRPVAEIAEVLEIPEGTVKSDLSRARDQLRNALTSIDPNVTDPKEVER